MAQGAVVQLSFPGETRRIEHVLSRGFRRMGRLVFGMLAPIAVAPFTVNAQLVLAGVPHRGTIGLEPEGGAMTLEASQGNEASEVHSAIHITGAVYPLLYSGQIGDW